MSSRRALELALDSRCNLRCLGCRSCHDTGERLAPGRAAALLREARAAGARTAWFGGGEPTLREELPALVRRARQLGYEEVVVQTNGLRLVYAAYAGALVDAGVTEIRVNAKSHHAGAHDRLSRVDGAHALLVQALATLQGLAAAAGPGAASPPVRVTADVLLARSTLGELADTIAFFAGRGVRAFALWLLSSFDAAGDAEVEAEVPRLADVAAALERAAPVARERGVALVSYHTPPCTLAPALRGLWQPAGELAMTVVDPAGHAFPLESSPFEGGERVPACGACAARDRCAGPRADYLRLHGAGEFRALSSLEEGPR